MISKTLPVEELVTQRLVPPLDLAGRGRRPGAVRMWRIPFSPADPIEQHLAGPGPNRPVNTLPLSVRISSGTPWRPSPAPTRRTPAAPSPAPRPAQRHEPRVIIDPRHDLRLGPIREADPPDDVHLPQLHRPRPFPTLVIRTLPLPSLRCRSARDGPDTDRSTCGPATGSTPSSSSQ